MNKTRKSLFHFLEKDYSFQTQSNFEFRWPLLFGDDSFLIDTLGFPEVDTNILYMYLDGYQIPVLGTPKFENNLRISIWVPEPFMEKYEELFDEVIRHGNFNKINDSTAFIIPLGNDNTEMSAGVSQNYIIRLFDTQLKTISADEFNSTSQALHRITLSLVYSAFDTNNGRNGSKDDFSFKWDTRQIIASNLLNETLAGK